MDDFDAIIQRAYIRHRALFECTTHIAQCPWCGASAVQVVSRGVIPTFFVMCDFCLATGPDGNTASEVVLKWNGCLGLYGREKRDV